MDISLYLIELKSAKFSFLNPLFWGILFVIFLIFARLWDTRRAFSFCLTTAVILLAATKLEGYVLNMFGDSFAPFLIRILLLFIMGLVFVYYAAIK